MYDSVRVRFVPVSPRDGRLKQLTQDGSYINELWAAANDRGLQPAQAFLMMMMMMIYTALAYLY